MGETAGQVAGIIGMDASKIEAHRKGLQQKRNKDKLENELYFSYIKKFSHLPDKERQKIVKEIIKDLKESNCVVRAETLHSNLT